MKIRAAYICCLCFLLACMSTQNSIWAETPQSHNETSGTFDDILLVVHYNHAHYNTMEFLKNLYSPFPNIVFYGETPHPSLMDKVSQYIKDVIQVPTHEGFYFSRVVADALSRFPQYRGYIFVQDDVLMNFWNYPRLNKDKIWFAISFFMPGTKTPPSWDPNFDRNLARNEFFNPVRDGFWRGRFDSFHGLPRLNPLIKQLEAQDRKILSQNLGISGRVGMVCDMFYIPQTFRQNAIRLGNLFKDVFCEVSIPMMLVCLDKLQNWEYLKGEWNFNLTDPNRQIYRHDADWIHPLKFSSSAYQDYAKKIVQEHTHDFKK